MKDKDEIKLYIELLKKTLSFALWDETFAVVDDTYESSSKITEVIEKILSRLLSIRGLNLCRVYHPKEFHAQAHTMLPMIRLNNLQFCVEDVIRNDVPGDFIEAGVWRGGACILIKGILKAFGIDNRKVFVADSFQGLPKPEYKEDAGDEHHLIKCWKISLDQVKENFRKYDLLDSRVVFLPGWFKDTLKTDSIEKLAVLRLDGDMYQSIMEALTHLYPKLSEGGYCIIDDWEFLPNVTMAVKDYRNRNNILDEIKVIDNGSAYWQKSYLQNY